MTLPRNIWTYWEQGMDSAPPLVRRCIESWEYWNPGWKVHVLDRKTLGQHTDLEQRVDLSREDITVQKRANLLRVALLRTHGGVWADATVMCSQPLETWLPDYASNGFFAFRNPGRDRLGSNWFLAAEPDNPLLVELEAAYVDLFTSTEYTLQNTRLGGVYRRLLKPFMTRNVACSKIWISPGFRKVFRVYPYFHFQYTFNKIVLSDGEPAQVWHRAKPYEVGDARRVRILSRAAGEKIWRASLSCQDAAACTN